MSLQKCQGTETTWDGNNCSGNLMTQTMIFADDLYNNTLTPQIKNCFYEKLKQKYSPKDICPDDHTSGCEDPDDTKLTNMTSDIKKIVDECSENDLSTPKLNTGTMIFVILLIIIIIGSAIYKFFYPSLNIKK